jgi:serine/threonine protein phosphatase PrpC
LVESSCFTHPGNVRNNNEDSYYVSDDRGLWAVCDGMGGHQEGNFASHLVTDIFERMQIGGSFDEKIEAITSQLYNIHLILQKKAQKTGRNAVIGTTVVVLLVEGQKGACMHAGDSRCYLLRDGGMSQVTEDHAKEIDTPRGRRKVLVNALSAGASVRAIGNNGKIAVLARRLVRIGVAPGIPWNFLFEVRAVPLVDPLRAGEQSFQALLAGGVTPHIQPIGIQGGFKEGDLALGGFLPGFFLLPEKPGAHEGRQKSQDDHHDEKLDEGKASARCSFTVAGHIRLLFHKGSSLILKMAVSMEITIKPTTAPMIRIMAGSRRPMSRLIMIRTFFS